MIAQAMSVHLKMILAIASLAVMPTARAVEQSIICPAEISASSIKITGLPQRWQLYVASPLYLSSAGASAGPPEQAATLMGDSTWKRGQSDWTTSYDLSDDGFAAGKWMECRYGEYGQVLLSTRLQDKTKSCTVHFSKGEKAGQRSVQITCR
jgi:hypothetical protein